MVSALKVGGERLHALARRGIEVTRAPRQVRISSWEWLDVRIPELVGALDGGVMFLTGDHGCDPTTPSTDHSRERTPMLSAGLEGGPYDVGARETYADLGATVAELLAVPWDLQGSSFAREIGR